jgi:hypothetical protein
VAHVNLLLGLVDAPYFMLIYHDDTITPDYIRMAVTELEANPAAVVAHGAVRVHGLRNALVRTASIRGAMLERAREFIQRGPTSAELAQRGVIRSSVLRAGGHFRSRRSDGMFANTLWSLELLLSGDSIEVRDQYYDKYLDPDGLSRQYHGRSLQERSRMLGESVANLATMLSEHGIGDADREELVRAWVDWLLGLQGNWNVLFDEPISDARSVAEARGAVAAFVANVISSLLTPQRRRGSAER